MSVNPILRGGVVIDNSVVDKYMCKKCHKKFTESLSSYYLVENDMSVPKIIDHISKLRLFSRVKQIFADEVSYFENEVKFYQQQNKQFKNIIKRATTILIENEKKNSSIDLRTILAKNMTKSQLDGLAQQLAP